MDAQAFLRRVTWWGRARNGLRAGTVGAALVLGSALVGRGAGVSPSPLAWLAVPVFAAAGGAWPLSRARFLLVAGRRLGVGERLAALEVVARRGTHALVAPLAAEVQAARPRSWKVITGSLELALLAATVALALGLVLVRPAPPAPEEAEGGAPAFQAEAPSAPGDEPTHPVTFAPATFPVADVPVYSPYEDLLAMVLGLELSGTGEEGLGNLSDRLAQEEGLLRTLAEQLRAAAPGGLSPAERGELLPLAREVSRADLRARLARLVGEEGDAAAAAEAVEAVLDAAKRAGEEKPPSTEEAAGSPAGAGSGTPTLGFAEDWEVPLSDSMFDGPENDAGLDIPDHRRGREVDLPGTTAGEPLEGGVAGDWGAKLVGEERVPITPGEGPLRAYLVLSVPGEPPPAGESLPAVLSPQEVEVVLRARGVPPELRDLVRRYFELIGGKP